ncbi:hypothetical protein [Neisseria sp.]|uniref:hypothetical protein n=1 Tax=Neisseria sp. TaxID=192066 RepID=UPI0035A1C570
MVFQKGTTTHSVRTVFQTALKQGNVNQETKDAGLSQALCLWLTSATTCKNAAKRAAVGRTGFGTPRLAEDDGFKKDKGRMVKGYTAAVKRNIFYIQMFCGVKNHRRG